MTVPLTKYGWPEVAIWPGVVLVLMAVLPIVAMAYLPIWAIVSAEVILAAVLVWILSFFRDPHRRCPSDRNVLLAPADGRVTDIELSQEDDFIAGPTLRIGIFLSIFNTHINRAPCHVRVEKITYKQGKYKNAMNPESGQVNESNNIGLVRTDDPRDRLMVRQISGAIARRIVCRAHRGQQLAAGEKFGMIKFGSRTELRLSAREDATCLVRVGDKVKAGLTPLVRYDRCPN